MEQMIQLRKDTHKALYKKINKRLKAADAVTKQTMETDDGDYSQSNTEDSVKLNQDLIENRNALKYMNTENDKNRKVFIK